MVLGCSNDTDRGECSDQGWRDVGANIQDFKGLDLVHLGGCLDDTDFVQDPDLRGRADLVITLIHRAHPFFPAVKIHVLTSWAHGGRVAGFPPRQG